MRKLYENFHIFHFQKRKVSAETIRGNKVLRQFWDFWKSKALMIITCSRNCKMKMKPFLRSKTQSWHLNKTNTIIFSESRNFTNVITLKYNDLSLSEIISCISPMPNFFSPYILDTMDWNPLSFHSLICPFHFIKGYKKPIHQNWCLHVVLLSTF